MLRAPITCRTCAAWAWPAEKRGYVLDAPCLTHHTITAATDWCDGHEIAADEAATEVPGRSAGGTASSDASSLKNSAGAEIPQAPATFSEGGGR